MPKISGSPRFVLVISQQGETVCVTASESNSQEEFRRLKKTAKNLVVTGADKDGLSARVYLVQEPEQLSQATLITDFEVKKWLKEKEKRLAKKTTGETNSTGG